VKPNCTSFTELGHDAWVGDEFLGHRDGLAGIALRVLENVGKRPALDAAGAVDFIKGKIEALLPLGAILRVRTGQRAADAQVNGISLRRPGLGARGNNGCQDKSGSGANTEATVDCGHGDLARYDSDKRAASVAEASLLEKRMYCRRSAR
jgi:hypothetical protein